MRKKRRTKMSFIQKHLDAALNNAAKKLPFGNFFGSLSERDGTDGWENEKWRPPTRMHFEKKARYSCPWGSSGEQIITISPSGEIVQIIADHESCGGHWFFYQWKWGQTPIVLVDEKTSSECWADNDIAEALGNGSAIESRKARVLRAFRPVLAAIERINAAQRKPERPLARLRALEIKHARINEAHRRTAMSPGKSWWDALSEATPRTRRVKPTLRRKVIA
jgi:hypothetical protein